MAHVKEKVVKDNAERWLLTYADLMNLLLIFFIILYSISQTDIAKFEQFANSVRASMGVSVSTNSQLPPSGSAGASVVPINSMPSSAIIRSQMEQEQMDEIKKKINDLAKKNKLGNNIDATIEKRGVNITITAQLLFRPGSAILEPNARPTIQEIGNILLQIPGKQIRVEGHTDSDPIHNSMFSSNLDLSVARATNVVKLLISKTHINPKIIAPTGYGEYWPVEKNTSAKNKAKNRRVNIVILKDLYSQADPTTISN